MQYTTKLSTHHEYMVVHLQDDLRRGFLCLKLYVAQHNIFTVKDAAQLAHLANKDLNDLIESIAHIHCGDDPTSEKEALAGLDAEEWRELMHAELDALVALGCWTYKPKHLKLAGKKVFQGKMVLKTKPPANGQPARKKSRYVISDPKFLQKLTDIDCFSLMYRLKIVQYLLVAVVERNWGCISTDIKNAFPCAKLPEPAWMEVPKSALDMYSNPESDRYDLDKYKELKNSYTFISSALYGLGHSPCAFHQHLDKWFHDNGWQALEADSCAYIKLNTEGQHVVAMATSFVDDCICMGTDEALNDY